MKTFRYIFFYTLLGFTVLSFSRCEEPAGPTETEADKNKKMMTTGAWSVESVTVGGVDQTSMYGDLTITFTATSYTTTNGGSVWPASGQWQFTSETGTTVLRSDGVDISINEISANRIVLSLLWNKTTYGPGRTASVAGQHVFTLTR